MKSAHWNWAVRSVALFLGGFGWLNLLRPDSESNFDSNLWWLDLRAVPETVRLAALVVLSSTLVAFGLAPRMGRWRRWSSVMVWCAAAVIALINSVTYYGVISQGSVEAGVPIPFSGVVLLVLIGLCYSAFRPKTRLQPLSRDYLELAGGVALCGIMFVLLQIVLFGKTDYRRTADVAVVLGARAYPDGHLSDALTDRVQTACQLYQQGRVRFLLFSGGPVNAAMSETLAMRRYAEAAGVPANAIIEDPKGINTDATIRNTLPLLRSLGASRVLVVSHFYHLPRIKLGYHQAGMEVFTVPAQEHRFIAQTPYSVIREVPAWWSYYFKGFKSPGSRI